MSDPYITTETASKINDALNAVWKQYEKDILPGIQRASSWPVIISEYMIVPKEHTPRWLLIKWKLQYWRLRMGIRVGGWIANHPLEESYDYDA